MQMRSFTDYLRSVDDAALLELFTLRPDLISPVPSDLASLAVRACSAPSLARATGCERCAQCRPPARHGAFGLGGLGLQTNRRAWWFRLGRRVLVAGN